MAIAATGSALFLDTIEGETALLRAVISNRLIGPAKNFAMVSVMLNLKDSAGQEYDKMPPNDVWRKVGTFWDLDVIESGMDEESSQDTVATSQSEEEPSDPAKPRHFVPFNPFTIPTLYNSHVAPRALNATGSVPPSSDEPHSTIGSRRASMASDLKPVISGSGRKGKQKRKDAEAGNVSDESELTEQEEEDRDGQDYDDEEEETSPKRSGGRAAKRARSTRSVSAVPQSDEPSPVPTPTTKRAKPTAASRKAAAAKKAAARRAKR